MPGIGDHHPSESVITMLRNPRSRWSGIHSWQGICASDISRHRQCAGRRALAGGIRGRAAQHPRCLACFAAAVSRSSQHPARELGSSPRRWVNLALAGGDTLGADPLRAHQRHRPVSAPRSSFNLAARVSRRRGRASAAECPLGYCQYGRTRSGPLPRSVPLSARIGIGFPLDLAQPLS